MSRGWHWFRADLRLADNTALTALAARVEQLGAVFVLDPRLAGGEHAHTARLRFLLGCLAELRGALERHGVALRVLQGRPEQLLPRLLHESGAHWLSFNEGATPFARRRDAAVRSAVERAGGCVLACADHVVFRAGELRTGSGTGYRVYTPYRRAWRARWRESPRLPLGRLRLPAPIPAARGEKQLELGPLGSARGTEPLPAGEAAARRRSPASRRSSCGTTPSSATGSTATALRDFPPRCALARSRRASACCARARRHRPIRSCAAGPRAGSTS